MEMEQEERRKLADAIRQHADCVENLNPINPKEGRLSNQIARGLRSLAYDVEGLVELRVSLDEEDRFIELAKDVDRRVEQIRQRLDRFASLDQRLSELEASHRAEIEFRANERRMGSEEDRSSRLESIRDGRLADHGRRIVNLERTVGIAPLSRIEPGPGNGLWDRIKALEERIGDQL